MSESKHLPGPLVAHKQPEGDIIDHAYSILTNGEECRCVALINLDVGTFADLRLWASAPDLLEALKYVMSAHGEQLTDAFDQAHKAIAKAEGRDE